MTHSREDLEKLSMKQLRDIGEPLGARDTKKSELIHEIMVKQKYPFDEETEKLIQKLEGLKGDFVQFHDNFDEIMDKLRKLRNIEGGMI